ncbi:MAG: flavodoxin family protein [Planctomycetota bacterium]
MAKKIVAFIGSPRKKGNTDTLVTELLAAAEKAGATTEKIYLSDLNIKPCNACDSCHKKDPPQCVISDDDFAATADKMKAADVVVFGTPVYWWTVSSQCKPFMDRWYGLLDSKWNSPFKGKSAAVVVCCQDSGTKAMTDPIVHTFRESFSFLGIDLVDTVTATAHAKGEVAENKKAMAKAAEVGRKLAAL